MKESINMKGHLTLILSDKKGKVVQQHEHYNHIVTTGRELVAQLFGGTRNSPPPKKVEYMGVGTDGTDPEDHDTHLEAQREPRKQIESVEYEEFTEEGIQRIRTRLTAVFDYGEANDATVPLQEAAIFTAEIDGVMYNRVVFPPVTKTDAFKLTLMWDIVF